MLSSDVVRYGCTAGGYAVTKGSTSRRLVDGSFVRIAFDTNDGCLLCVCLDMAGDKHWAVDGATAVG